MRLKRGLGLSLVAFLLIVLLTTTLSFGASQVEASPTTIYVPDDYSTIQAAVDAASPGDTIIVRDGTYNENVSVNKQLTIQSENGPDNCIVKALDPNYHVFEINADYVNITGFTVQNATGYRVIAGECIESAGIYLGSGVEHSNISNNNATNNHHGICLLGSSNNMLTNNNASKNIQGIYLEKSSNNTLTNSTANSNGLYGIYLYSSSNNTLINNTASDNNRYGILLYPAHYNTLTGNTANLNSFGIGLQDSTNNVLTSNNASNNNNNGIFLFQSDHNELKDNLASSNKLGGIVLGVSGSNTLTGNATSNNKYGIKLYNGYLWGGYPPRENILRNNSMSNNEYNFHISGTYKEDFIQYIDETNYVNGKPIYYLLNKENVQIPSDAGYVGIVNGSNITVKDLTLKNNGQGVLLVNTTNSRIENVIVEKNDYGIYLFYSSNNTLTNNTASNNRTGIQLYSSNDNKIFLNNFTDNSDNVYSDKSTNIWKSTEEITYTYKGNTYISYLGNYWSDYEGSDDNGDGIGDTPYSIDSDKDNYPLMGVWKEGVINSSPNRPSNVLPADGDKDVVLTPTLHSFPFSDPDEGDVHATSQWQIRKADGDYSSPVFDSGRDTQNLTTIIIPEGKLSYSTTYYWRVRHQDNHGAWSEWSQETSFTTMNLPGDIDGSGKVDAADLAAVAAAFNTKPPSNPAADLNKDGKVDVSDLVEVGRNFGRVREGE